MQIIYIIPKQTFLLISSFFAKDFVYIISN